MKFISFSLIFAIIVALGVIFVAPLFQTYHEGILQQRGMAALADAGYENSSLEVDHLHAKRIVIHKLSVTDEEKEAIRIRAAEKLRAVPGLYADKADVSVVVKVEAPKIDPVIVENIPPKKVKEVEIKPEPKPEPDLKENKGAGSSEEIPKPAVVLTPAAVDIIWDDKKSHITLTGKVASEEVKSKLASELQQSIKGVEISNKIKVSPKTTAKLQHYDEVSDVIPRIIAKAYHAGAIKYSDEPASIEVTGLTESVKVYHNIQKDLAQLSTVNVQNKLFILPRFSVIKSDKSKSILIKGYVKDTASSLGIGSSVSQLSGYHKDNQIKLVKQCLDVEWTDEKQKELARQLASLKNGKITYLNHKIIEIVGDTEDAAYKESMEAAYANSGVVVKLQLLTESLPDPVESARSQLAKGLKECKVFFRSGSDYVAKKYDPKLNQVAELIKSSPDQTSIVVIGGYADNTGNPESNKQLSLKRARAVLRKLIAFGVPASRTEVQFFGAEDNPDKAASRRVEIKVKQKN